MAGMTQSGFYLQASQHFRDVVQPSATITWPKWASPACFFLSRRLYMMSSLWLMEACCNGTQQLCSLFILLSLVLLLQFFSQLALSSYRSSSYTFWRISTRSTYTILNIRIVRIHEPLLSSSSEYCTDVVSQNHFLAIKRVLTPNQL